MAHFVESATLNITGDARQKALEIARALGTLRKQAKSLDGVSLFGGNQTSAVAQAVKGAKVVAETGLKVAREKEAVQKREIQYLKKQVSLVKNLSKFNPINPDFSKKGYEQSKAELTKLLKEGQETQSLKAKEKTDKALKSEEGRKLRSIEKVARAKKTSDDKAIRDAEKVARAVVASEKKTLSDKVAAERKVTKEANEVKRANLRAIRERESDYSQSVRGRLSQKARTIGEYAIAGAPFVAGARASKGAVAGDNERFLNNVIVNNPKIEAKIDDAAKLASKSRTNVTDAHLMSAGRDLYKALGDSGADKIPELLKVQAKGISSFAAIYQDLEKGKRSGDLAMKIAGMTGAASDPEKYKTLMDTLIRSAYLTGKDVDPTLARQTLKGAGASNTSGLTADAMSLLLQSADERGYRVGDELKSFNRQMMSNSINKKDIAAQKKYGLRDSKGYSVLDKELKQDPYSVVLNKLLPMIKADIKKIGNKDYDKLDDAEKSSEVYKALERMGITGKSQEKPLAIIANEKEIRNNKVALSRMNIDKTPDTIAYSVQSLDASLQKLGNRLAKGGASDAFKGVTDFASRQIDNDNLVKAAAFGAVGFALKTISNIFTDKSLGKTGQAKTDGHIADIDTSTKATALATGKMALTGGAGGLLGLLNPITLKAAAIAAVAGAGYVGIKALEGKRDERLKNDPIEKHREELTNLKLAEYDAFGNKVADNSQAIIALTSEISRMEKNEAQKKEEKLVPKIADDQYFDKSGNQISKAESEKIEETEYRNKFGKKNWRKKLAEDRAKEKEKLRLLNFKTDHDYEDPASLNYIPPPKFKRGSDDPVKTPKTAADENISRDLTKMILADLKNNDGSIASEFRKMGLENIESARKLGAELKSAVDNPLEAAKNLGTTLTGGLASAATSAASLVSALAGLANIKMPTFQTAPKLNTGVAPQGFE